MFGIKLLTELMLLCTLYAPTSASPSAAADFDPNNYGKNFVRCPAVDRSGPKEKKIDLRLGYLDINPRAKETLILVHGWPSLWTTYRHQIQHFGRDYRLIIPEHRGYGDSQHPRDLNSSNTMYDFSNDILCMMDDAGVDAGVCVGNDFGAQVCWEAGRSRPDRFIGVFNVGLPYVSARGNFSTNEVLAKANKFFGYQLYLGNTPEKAAKEMDADTRSAIRSVAHVAGSTLPPEFLTKTDTFLQPWKDHIKANNLTEIPFSGIMSKKVEDYMVKSYKKQGFYNTYNGYQYGNRKLTYDHEKHQGNFTIPQPTFLLYPTRDPVANWQALAAQVKSIDYLPNHYNATIPTAHWPHEEMPDLFNSILSQWLGNVTFP